MTTKPTFAPLFLEGITRFNALQFWDAHESWEELWLEAESDLHQFLQGLIQIAAAYVHVKRGTFRGAVRLFDAGLRRLDAFPLVFCGIDRSAVDAAARVHREWVAAILAGGDASSRLAESDYPKLALVSTEESPMPPYDEW